MKRVLTVLALLIIFCTSAWSQAKKPTIMVMPADRWCERNGYMTDFVSMGQTTRIPNYSEAFLQDRDLSVVMAAMSDFMAANDFPLQSLEQELKRIQQESTEMALMTGKNSGAGIEETPVEQIRRTAKADILLSIDFVINQVGPRRQVEFTIDPLDAYTSKSLGAKNATSSPVSSSVPMTTILEESVLSFKDAFLASLQHHFDDMFANGREITVTLMRFDSCPIDFEEEFDVDGESVELADLIDDWFAENTVNGRYTVQAKSANRLRFSQVRIPLYATVRGKERAIDAQQFGNRLASMLKKEPYNLTVGVTPKGLGEVWLTIGDK